MSNPFDHLNRDRIVELTKEMIAIPSISGQEHAMSDYVYTLLEKMGLPNLTRVPVDESGDAVIGWIDGGDGPTQMLNFHLDTFDVTADWVTDPFEPVLQGNKLYGLGSHDMIGGAACVLAAAEAILRSGVPLPGKLIISATSDEENWSRGAHALIDSGLLDGCEACLIPEPTPAGWLHAGFRGRHVMRLRLHGKTIHAAFEDDDGINAVVDAARVVAELDKLERYAYGYSEEFDMYGNMAVTSIQGGSTMILIPEVADVIIDWHPLPGDGPAEAAKLIEGAVARSGIRSRTELTWDERPTAAPAGYRVAADSPFLAKVTARMALEQGQPIRHKLGRSVNDASHFAVHGNIPTLVYGPQGGNTCAANEYLDIESVMAVARTFVALAVESF